MAEKKLPKGITLRKDGRYMARFQYEGERYTLYDNNLKELLEKVDNMKYELKHGMFCKPKELTVTSWFDTWIDQYKSGTCKASTIQTYRQSFENYIKPILGKRKVTDIQPQIMQKIINDLHKNGFSKSRVNIVYAILCGMFEQAQRNKLIINNPADALVFPKFRRTNQDDRRVMTLEEQRIFLEYAQDSKYYNFYVMALATGMRINEITALQWTDIDWINKIIHVTGTLVYVRKDGGRYKDNPKTESSRRDIPMLSHVETMLKDIRKAQLENRLLLGAHWKEEKGLENLVFTYESGGALWDTGIRVDMKKTIEKIHAAGIEFEPITPHTFRHTFATRGLEQGIPLKVMQTILGHSSLSMTSDLYAHVLPDTKVEEMKKLENVL